MYLIPWVSLAAAVFEEIINNRSCASSTSSHSSIEPISEMQRSMDCRRAWARCQQDDIMPACQYFSSPTPYLSHSATFFSSDSSRQSSSQSLCMILPPLFRMSQLTSRRIIWGCVMTAMGYVNNWSGLMAARWFLGMAEAGLYPGVNYFLSCWYKRDEFGIRAVSASNPE